MASTIEIPHCLLRRNGLNKAKGIIAFAIFVSLGLPAGSLVAQSAPDLSGNWQGSVEAGRGFRVVLQISPADLKQADQSKWQGVFASLSNAGGTQEWNVTSITLEGTMLRYSIPHADMDFEGKLSADGRSLAGTLKYSGASYALNLTRATADTAWAIPEATKNMPPDAAPEFEVATIKPTDPSWSSSGFHDEGRRISCDNETVKQIVAFAFGIHLQQIVNGPTWLGSDRYTIDGVPDVAGQPDLKQMQEMYRAVLASRFNLTFHHEEKDLSVYAISLGKGAPKLAKSLGDPNGLPDTTFTRWSPQLIELHATNVTMADFDWALGMTLDRPVVDQTNLSGRFDFVVKWTPEGAPANDPSAPPDIFTALREQLGLKIEATKTPANVLVIDHVDRPSPN